METRSLALKHVSEAINFDSSGFKQAAFAKYLQSLQILTLYLNDLFISLGYQNILEKGREIKHVLCMIRECADRVEVIINDHGKPVLPNIPAPKYQDTSGSYMEVSDTENAISQKFPAFEKMQNEKMLLIKTYEKRLAAADKYTRTNLTLELERRLAENDVLTRKKYDIAVKQLQKERVKMMENAIRKLFEKDRLLTEKEREKQELYTSVLQYVKTEIWPCSWKLNSYELSVSEAAEKIFYKIIRCCEHPLSQWLMVMQTNIKREIDTILKQYSGYLPLLPDLLHSDEMEISNVKEVQDNLIIKIAETQEIIQIPHSKFIALQRLLGSIATDITSAIGNTLQIFYFTYKSILPDDSETICYHLIERYFLEPIWLNLLTLFRILNLSSEFKVSETMLIYKKSDPSKFGILIDALNEDVAYNHSIFLLHSIPKYRSLVDKLKVLVQISQKICGSQLGDENIERKIGADELIPLLCYIIVQSKLPQLVSEFYAIEQLFDMKFMLGEEGYALSSFLTALKYIEVKKLSDCEDTEDSCS